MKRPSSLELVGAVVIGAAGVVAMGFFYVWQSIGTGDPQLDRMGIRMRIAIEALRVFGPRAAIDLRIPRALMAIVHNESGGNPAHYLGDATLGGGPSIGPMQVYRSTAKDLGLWQPELPGESEEDERADYAELASNEALGIEWGVKVFANKLELAGGNVEEAIRRYNGSGSAAEAYKSRALAFAGGKGWDFA